MAATAGELDRVQIIDFDTDLAEDFKRLNVEWLEKYFWVEPIDEIVLSDPGGQIIEPGGHILFAALDTAIVGTAALKHHGNGVYELTKMAVTERHQGVGIGRALLVASIARFEAVDGRQLYLESHSSLETALGLYASAGFCHSPRPAPSEYARSDVYMVYRPS
ncbi:MAG: GNAT family N-acetyltransferase [Gammaproteobacteria bacterium]|nr:GNAT family N-acetyltransferase [Gammaproteobacteria bacterium]